MSFKRITKGGRIKEEIVRLMRCARKAKRIMEGEHVDVIRIATDSLH